MPEDQAEDQAGDQVSDPRIRKLLISVVVLFILTFAIGAFNLLITLHLHDGQPVPLPRTVGPGAQQRRLPAAGRSRDDRHLLRRRAIQRSEKITPVDQPESCPSHQASVRTINHRAEPQFCSAPIRSDSRAVATVSSRPAPSRVANHRDPVKTSHLLHSNPGSVDRMAKENDMTLDNEQIASFVGPGQ